MDFNIVEKLLGLTLLGTEWVLWLLIISSIVSVSIMLERWVYFLRTRMDFSLFTHDLTEKLLKDDLDGIKHLCRQYPSLASDMVLKAFDYKEHGLQAMDQGMQGFLAGARQHLDRGLVVLGTLGNNAPFIGLFGTVIGIIQAFADLAANPAGGPSVVMAGISEALVATAVGLMVAIPAVIAYNWFNRIIKRRYANAESVRKMITAHYANEV